MIYNPHDISFQFLNHCHVYGIRVINAFQSPPEEGGHAGGQRDREGDHLHKNWKELLIILMMNSYLPSTFQSPPEEGGHAGGQRDRGDCLYENWKELLNLWL